MKAPYITRHQGFDTGDEGERDSLGDQCQRHGQPGGDVIPDTLSARAGELLFPIAGLCRSAKARHSTGIN